MLGPVDQCGPPPYSCNRTIQTLCNTYDKEAKLTSWTSISNNEDEIAQALVTTGPLSVLIDASSLSFYRSGIFNPQFCNPDTLNHAVLLVGYGEDDDGTQYWIIKNSWGASWGDEGYFKMIKGVNKCGIANAVTTAII